MKGKRFLLFFFLILAFSFLLRVMPTQNNNFFFTEDQGSDAIWIREVVERGQIILRGPETGIKGVFAGPLWFYFVSIGYRLFDGHPFGALFMMIVLNVFVTGVLMWLVARRCNPRLALFLGIALQANWFFYDTSRWGFNPFPLVALSLFLILLLSESWRAKKSFFLGLIPIFLAFNTEVAGAGALLLFYIVAGLLFVWKKVLSLRTFLISVFGIPFLFLLPVLFDFSRQFLKTRVFFNVHSLNVVGTFTGTNFSSMLGVFLDLLARGIIPQSAALSLVVFAGVLFLFAKYPTDRNTFKRHFVFLILLLFGATYFWFSLNKGWRDWHTVYLPPLIFIALFLMISAIPKKIGFLLLVFVLGAQLFLFKERYKEFYSPSYDAGLLVNKLKVVDWIYQESRADGFKVYTYSSHFWDYPYQYLFFWHGKKEYGYVPCDYRNHPGVLKHVYVSGADFYSRPTLGCGKFTFLIIERDSDIPRQSKWIAEVGRDAKIIDKVEIGEVTVEKRINQD